MRDGTRAPLRKFVACPRTPNPRDPKQPKAQAESANRGVEAETDGSKVPVINLRILPRSSENSELQKTCWLSMTTPQTVRGAMRLCMVLGACTPRNVEND